jgi:hypothetical protein
MDGGPLPHSMNVKKFVGCRNAARRARRYILTTPAFMTRTTKDTNADLGEFKDKSGTPYVRRADGSVVSVWIRQLREQGHTRHAAKQIIREAIYVDGDIS